MEANKDLEIYKLAFELACDRLGVLDQMCGGSCKWDSKRYQEWALQKAREEYGDLD